jgi:hypothetical protein
MPIDINGRWESWAKRNEREKAAKAEIVAATPDEIEALHPEPKARKPRRNKAAAAAAIADATGTIVDLEDMSDTLASLDTEEEIS